MYYKYGDQSVLDAELKRAIPAFLNRGLLITNVQEAVGVRIASILILLFPPCFLLKSLLAKRVLLLIRASVSAYSSRT